MPERLGALVLAGAACGLCNGFATPGVFVDLVLVVGWGHLLGAVLGDARRLRGRVAPASELGFQALCVLGLLTGIAAGSAALALPLFQAFLLAGVFLHVFENEASEAATSSDSGLGAPSRSRAAWLGAVAPTLALAVLVLAARSPAERRGFDPPFLEGPFLPCAAVAFAAAALVTAGARGRGAVALVFLSAAALAPHQSLLHAADAVALLSLYHFLRFAIRLARTASGRRRGLCVHAAPAAIVAGGVWPPLSPWAGALLEPGLFLLGAFVHGLHTTAVRAWARPRAA